MKKPVLMIVEDDPDVRETLGSLLERKGYDVILAANGREALENLHDSRKPCLILLDLMMPVMDGWKFRIEQLQAPHLAKIPIVVLSGVAHLDDAVEALGAHAHLAKPFKPAQLYDIVEAVC